MARRAFPAFFAARVQLPPDGVPGYIGLRRDDSELAVVAGQWPVDRYGLSPGKAPNFEMLVYVENVDNTVDLLRQAGVRVLRSPNDMPPGERAGRPRPRRQPGRSRHAVIWLSTWHHRSSWHR
ncbi:MAG: hypothetical protein M3069_31385 [Chloroflexota bacterium]|nr:hypothetical protein [Chloroflexota bacterium]